MSRKVLSLILGCFAIAAMAAPASAEVVLNDWCFNLNGDTTSACNQGTPVTLPSNVNGSGFDFTLNNPPGTANNLGTVKITLAPGSGQFVLAYMDYDLNFAASGSFQDVGSVHGSPPPGVTYELADPAGSIFSDFAANALTNVNGVATGSPSPSPCCDVSWALGVGGLNVPVGSEALLMFAASTTKPTSGFYLEQSNIQDGEAVYLTATVSIVSTVPLPNSLLLLATGFAALQLIQRRSSPRAVAGAGAGQWSALKHGNAAS
jgi:hypothetical protein